MALLQKEKFTAFEGLNRTKQINQINNNIGSTWLNNCDIFVIFIH